MSNYYKILGIAKNATRSEIRKAYLQKAKQYHPDLNHSPDSLPKFKQIQEAYQILYDQNSRSQYDSSLNNRSSNYGHSSYSSSGYSDNYGQYGTQHNSFKDQFRAETEHLHRQWRDMEQERLRRATEENFHSNNQQSLNEILNDIFKVLALNTFIGNRFKFFIYIILRMLPAMAMPLFFLLVLIGQFKSFDGERMTIVYDSYGTI